MPIQFDATGKMIPPGKTARVLEESFILGTMPSWLSATAGTATYGVQASTRGYLQMTTGAVSGNAATVKTSFEINLLDQKAILWEASSLVFDSNVINFAMGIAGSGSKGAYVKQDSTDTVLVSVMAGSGSSSKFNAKAGEEAIRRRNVGLLLLPATRELYVLEDDQIAVHRTHTSIVLGAVACDLSVTTREAVAHNFCVGKLKLTLFSD